MQLIPSSFNTTHSSNNSFRTDVEDYTANKLSRDSAADAKNAPRFNANAAQDIRQVIDRYDRSCEQEGLKETNRVENNQLHTVQGDSALTCSIGAYSAASGNFAQKLCVAAKGFVASVMQDLRSFGQVCSELVERSGAGFKKYFASFEHAPRTLSAIAALVGGVIGVGLLGPIGASFGLGIGNYIGHAAGLAIAKATAKKGDGPSWRAVRAQSATWGYSRLKTEEGKRLLKQLKDKEANLQQHRTSSPEQAQPSDIAKTAREIADIASVLEQGGWGYKSVTTSLPTFVPSKANIDTSETTQTNTQNTCQAENASVSHVKRLAQLLELENLALKQVTKPASLSSTSSNSTMSAILVK